MATGNQLAPNHDRGWASRRAVTPEPTRRSFLRPVPSMFAECLNRPSEWSGAMPLSAAHGRPSHCSSRAFFTRSVNCDNVTLSQVGRGILWEAMHVSRSLTPAR